MVKAKIPVQIDAEKLCKHTLKITSNLKNFPKKYRFTLVDKLVNLTFEIHDNICDANNSFDQDERILFIQKGISSCRKMEIALGKTMLLFVLIKVFLYIMTQE